MPGPVLPRELDGCHVLALPARADVRTLAVAWFAGAAWEVLPLGADLPAVAGVAGRRPGQPPMSFSSSPSRPGRLRLTARAGLVGPSFLPTRAARAQGLPAQDLDLYALDPQVSDPLVLGWMTAAARRRGGAVVSADRTQVIAPDPAASVDLTVWTGTVLPSGNLVAAVRPFLAGSRLGPVEQGAGGAYLVTSRFEFDGALTLTASPATAVPVAVAAHPWGDRGPWTYQVTWRPPGPAEPSTDQPSRVHLIARARVAPVIARATLAVLRLAGGVVVDGGGFPVEADELVERGTTL